MRSAIASTLFGDIAAPLRIGRFEVLQALGRGGMGVVYAAWDPALGRRVALKLVAAQHAGSPRHRARMVREAQALAKLSHPNVVHVYEVGEHDGDVFVAMELIEGVPLRDWLKEDRRSVREIEDVFLQAAAGLSAAHQSKLVHRDFKPSNAILGRDGRLRVIDFGLAFGPGLSTDSARGEHDARIFDGGSVTRTEAIVGTPAYMAPEQFKGKPADARADQFSFCVSLFEALSGSRPYPLDVVRGEKDNAEPIAWGSVPRRLRGPLRRGLSLTPAERWPSMDVLLDRLRRNRRWRGRAVWLASALVAAAGGLWLGTGSDPCGDLPDLEEAWNAPRAASIARVFDETGAPFAADVWASAEQDVVAFVEGWRDTTEQVCAAPAPSPGAVQCLGNARIRLDVVLSEYETVTDANVAQVHELSTLLGTPDACGQTDVQPVSESIDVHLLQRIVRARAEVTAARPAVAIETLTHLIEEPSLENTDALAELYALRGRAHAKLARPAEALQDLARSVHEASEPHRRARSLVAWVAELIEQERWESASDGMRLVEMHVPDTGPASLRADAYDLKGRIALAGGDVERATVLHEDALRLRTVSGNAQQAAGTKLLLANALTAGSGEASVARGEALYTELLDFYAGTLGKQHPQYATVLFDLGVEAAEKHEYKEALALLERAQAIQRRTLPLDSPARARTALKLAEVLIRLDRLHEARKSADAAWARLRALPATHSDHKAARVALANLTLSSGDYVASLDHHDALVKIQPDDPLIHQNIAYLSVQLGDATRARLAVTRARRYIAQSELDSDTQALLELYLRTLDARIAALDGGRSDFVVALNAVSADLRALLIPEDRPDLIQQRDALEEELAALRSNP